MSATMDSSLTEWVKNNFGALYDSSASHSSDETTFKQSFDTVFSPQAQIIMNHEPVTREQLSETIQGSAAAATGSTIEWKELFTTLRDNDPSQEVRPDAYSVDTTR